MLKFTRTFVRSLIGFTEIQSARRLHSLSSGKVVLSVLWSEGNVRVFRNSSSKLHSTSIEFPCGWLRWSSSSGSAFASNRRPLCGQQLRNSSSTASRITIRGFQRRCYFRPFRSSFLVVSKPMLKLYYACHFTGHSIFTEQSRQALGNG